MKIYFAGNTAVVNREKQIAVLCHVRLFSFFHILPGRIEHNVFDWRLSDLVSGGAGRRNAGSVQTGVRTK